MDKKILVLDDDIEIIEIIQNTIENISKDIFELNILTTEDVGEALKLLDTSKFDLVVTDLIMPNISGDRIIKIVRDGTSLNKNTPFLVVSGNINNPKIDFNKDNIDKVFFIEKPFSPEKLEKLVVLSLCG